MQIYNVEIVAQYMYLFIHICKLKQVTLLEFIPQTDLISLNNYLHKYLQH